MTVKTDTNNVFTTPDSWVVEMVLGYGKEIKANFVVMGEIPPTDEYVYFDNFRIGPMEKETCPIPKVVYKYHAGLKERFDVVQELIGHEVEIGEGLFGLPIPEIKPEVKLVVQPEVTPVKKERDWVEPALTIGGYALMGLVRLIILGLMVDPISICVVRDGSRYFWIRTCWWYE